MGLREGLMLVDVLAALRMTEGELWRKRIAAVNDAAWGPKRIIATVVVAQKEEPQSPVSCEGPEIDVAGLGKTYPVVHRSGKGSLKKTSAARTPTRSPDKCHFKEGHNTPCGQSKPLAFAAGAGRR